MHISPGQSPGQRRSVFSWPVQSVGLFLEVLILVLQMIFLKLQSCSCTSTHTNKINYILTLLVVDLFTRPV